jgi:hypothetical protein
VKRIVHEGQVPERSEQYRWQDREDESDRNRGSDGEQKPPPLAAPPVVEDVSPDGDRGETEEERETVEAGLQHHARCWTGVGVEVKRPGPNVKFILGFG